MRTRGIIFILVSFIALTAARAQTVQEIQTNPAYIWGVGNAPSLSRADSEALASLISQISTSVESHFSQLTEGGMDGSTATVNDSFESVIKTYSRATLNNTRRIIIQNEPDASVMRYIKVSEIERIFEGRRNKLIDFAQEAMKAEKKAQVADALRYYYWSMILLQSYPDGKFLKMKDDEGQEQLLCNWIPKQMNDIFAHLEVAPANVRMDGDLKTVNLNITYKGQPARNYDYTYFDGRDWSNIFSAKDGRGIIEVPSMVDTKGLQLRTEYMFEGEANIDAELAEVMRSVNPISMRNCYLKLAENDESMAMQTLEMESMAQEESATKNSMRFLEETESNVYLGTMNKIEEAIASRSFDAIEPLCTPEGLDMFNRLIKYGNAKIIRKPELQFLETNDEISCRSLPMSFNFKGNGRTFVEDVVFNLNKEGKITSLSFGLNEPAVDDIMEQTSWDENVRKVLINFLESYKTAYALKRHEYIESIFSDDALIITGSVLKHKTGTNENVQPLNKQAIKYTRQTKAEFMKRLKHIFNSNEFVNIRFADNQIRKSGVGGEIYGIQIKQDYFSSSYGDTGYLFLMVDLNKPKEPVIHVRTWQPEKDPDFGLVDLSHF